MTAAGSATAAGEGRQRSATAAPCLPQSKHHSNSLVLSAATAGSALGQTAATKAAGKRRAADGRGTASRTGRSGTDQPPRAAVAATTTPTMTAAAGASGSSAALTVWTGRQTGAETGVVSGTERQTETGAETGSGNGTGNENGRVTGRQTGAGMTGAAADRTGPAAEAEKTGSQTAEARSGKVLATHQSSSSSNTTGTVLLTPPITTSSSSKDPRGGTAGVEEEGAAVGAAHSVWGQSQRANPSGPSQVGVSRVPLPSWGL